MIPSVLDLPWLPPASEDTKQQLRLLKSQESPDGQTIQRLATQQLTSAQAGGLSRTITKHLQAGLDLQPLSGFKLGILSNATIDLMADSLPTAAARHGVALELVIPPFDQVMQQALDANSQINRGQCDAILLAVDHRWLNLDQPMLVGEHRQLVDNAIESLTSVVQGVASAGGATVILQTIPIPPDVLLGNLDAVVCGTIRSMLNMVNARIVELCADQKMPLLDIASLAERVGTDRWFDPVQWASYKLPFASDCQFTHADYVARMLGSMRGKMRKCLVLDLDNTCWGGAIGDAGLEGIVIGQGNALGEAFLSVQRTALQLRERGIVLAVCSKNNEDNARLPFREHADMLLREEHIAVFQANWTDKPSNLEAIAKALNIGIDSLVILDDNPAERAQIRAALPMIAVPELPDDPSWFSWILSAAGYFETLSFSDEDRLRASSYASNAQRAQVQAKSRDLGEYLTSLEMEMTVGPFDQQGRARITQLINKTNQFNLTTRRYTEAQVQAFEDDPACYTLQVRLQDRFGDLGMIALVIANESIIDGMKAWTFDSWLMSCRVLGRKVEQAMLQTVVAAAKESGVQLLIGKYLPTAKNNMVREHFDQLGFTLASETDDGVRHYRAAVDELETGELPLIIHS